MIGRLHGIIAHKQPPDLLLNVHGVYYEIQAPMSTFYQLAEIGSDATLHTHLLVREDAQLLYGFYTLKERSLFRTLIRVNGVGAKLALTILSSIEMDAFVQAIREKNNQTLARIPGIGKKTAERLIIETKDLLSQWNIERANATSDNNAQHQIQTDSIAALEALGYKTLDAKKAVNQVLKPDLTREQIIRLALKEIM